MALSIPFRPDLPMLLDTGAVIRSQNLVGTKYLGRIFYLKRRDWEMTRFPDYISREEADAYKSKNLTITLNFEDAAYNWCLGGYEVGRDRGNVAAEQLREIDCENAAVYLSVDFRPANANEMRLCMEALRGFQDSELGTRGRAVYGFAPTLREAKRLGLADYYWLCGDARTMYPEHLGGTDADLMGTVNIWQQNNEQPYFANVQIDDNYIYTPEDYGQWMPGEWEDRSQKMANADDVMKQMFGSDGKGWDFLGPSPIAAAAGTPRDNTLVEALGEVRDQLGGPDHNWGGWPQLGNLTFVDALSVLGWYFRIPGFEPIQAVKDKLSLTEEMRFKG